jgi:hypothetical protein
LQGLLAEKVGEREAILGLFRRKKISSEVAEKQREEIAQEEGTLQGLLASLKSQEDITTALAEQYHQAELLLSGFQGEDMSFERQRQIVQCLVREIVVDPEITHIDYAFSQGVFSSQSETPPAT